LITGLSVSIDARIPTSRTIAAMPILAEQARVFSQDGSGCSKLKTKQPKEYGRCGTKKTGFGLPKDAYLMLKTGLLTV